LAPNFVENYKNGGVCIFVHKSIGFDTIFEAIASVRGAIVFAEVKKKLLCILTLDFKEAFDRISHQYPFANLHPYGFSDSFMDRIRYMYENATSVVQVNGRTLVRRLP
jgi:hypothetical protein